MKLLSSIVVFGLSAFAASAAIPGNETSIDAPNLSKRCTVNAALIDTWHEAGLTRRRTAFSAEGTDVAAYCDYWNSDICQLDPGFNAQCGYDDQMNPPSWRIDTSWVLGKGGDNSYFGCLGLTRNEWIRDTACGTG